MTPTRRRALSVLATLLFAMLGVAVSGTNAYASTCSGYGCHGRDPYGAGCPISSTKMATSSLVTVWNRYSIGCNANWAEAQLTAAAVNAHDTMWVYISTTDNRGNYEFMCYPGPSNTGALVEGCTNPRYGGSLLAWTDMVDGTNLTTACADIYNASGTYLTTVCAPPQ
jgi:hypothetical protein